MHVLVWMGGAHLDRRQMVAVERLQGCKRREEEVTLRLSASRTITADRKTERIKYGWDARRCGIRVARLTLPAAPGGAVWATWAPPPTELIHSALPDPSVVVTLS
ncbi:hypothetical protein EYF80_002656 [Liparis tanakae]|uniref:Uncharacterized protein n=1 Tax=Liparis tanakae TaxID=230148 RepID=A0A4Z2JAD6_9TELE|nr:hypothetical protein EYF80_002656 [Liparis tanakae]